MKSAKDKETYLACLFLLMNVGRRAVRGCQDGPRQQLPVGQRLLSDYKGAASRTKKKSLAADEQGNVFAVCRGANRTEYIPTCHACGRKCKGGWRKCKKHITDDHMSKVAELDAARHFRSNSTIKATAGATRPPGRQPASPAKSSRPSEALFTSTGNC